MSSPFRRTLPPHPALDLQKTQAKELLQRFAADDAMSVARVRDALPDQPQIKLADAQFVVAREYGFSNWAALKQEIETRTAVTRSPELRMHEAFSRCDAKAVRKLFGYRNFNSGQPIVPRRRTLCLPPAGRAGDVFRGSTQR